MDSPTRSATTDQAGPSTPRVGFQSRDDFEQLGYSVAHNLFPPAASRWVQYGPLITGSSTWASSSGRLESRALQAGFLAITKSGWTWNAFGNADLEVVESPLTFAGGVTIPTGRYAMKTAGASFVTPSSLAIAGSGSLTVGEFFSGSKTTVVLSPSVTVTPDLLITGGVSYNRIRQADAAAESDPVSVRLLSTKVDYYFSTRLSAAAIVQHSSAADLVLGSLRIRYNPSEGNDLYLVINGDLNRNRYRVSPTLPASNRSTLQVQVQPHLPALAESRPHPPGPTP